MRVPVENKRQTGRKQIFSIGKFVNCLRIIFFLLSFSSFCKNILSALSTQHSYRFVNIFGVKKKQTCFSPKLKLTFQLPAPLPLRKMQMAKKRKQQEKKQTLFIALHALCDNFTCRTVFAYVILIRLYVFASRKGETNVEMIQAWSEGKKLMKSLSLSQKIHFLFTQRRKFESMQ